MAKLTIANKIFKDFRKGSTSAYEKLFKLYYPQLFKYASYFIEDPFQAEDLVQEVFIQVWNKRKEFKNKKLFASFLFTVLRNKCLNTLKRKVIEDKYLTSQAYLKSEELYHISFEIEDDFQSMEEKLSQELTGIIAEMPERCQEAFRLKWIEGKKIREIADVMNISTTMVDKHLAKGLQIARKKLTTDLFLLFVLINDID